MSDNSKNYNKSGSDCTQCVAEVIPNNTDYEGVKADLLAPSYNEKAEVIKNGFSYGSTVKDAARFYLHALNARLEADDITELVQNWEAYCKNIDNLNGTDVKVLAVKEVYYEVFNYIRSQILKDLGENAVFEYLEDGADTLSAFIKSNELRQRNFEYNLGKEWLTAVTESAIRCFQIKKDERAAVELGNLLFINSRIFENHRFIYNNGVIHNNPFLLQSINYGLEKSKVEPNAKFVEISPPTYEYQQKDLMLRIYDFENGNLKVNQLCLPYNLADCIDFLKSDFVTQNSVTYKTDHSEDPENNILARILCFNSEISIEEIANSFPTVQKIGGMRILQENDQMVNPILEKTQSLIDPFIHQLISQIPEILSNPSSMHLLQEKYKEVMLTAFATIDKNAKIEVTTKLTDVESKTFKNFIKQGGLIAAAVGGIDLNKAILQASNGKVSKIKVKAMGGCGVVEGTIEKKEVTSKQLIMNKREDFNEKKGKLVFFETINPKTGKEETHIECPICHKGSIDVCRLQDRCQSCGHIGHEIKSMYDKGYFAPKKKVTKDNIVKLTESILSLDWIRLAA